MLARPTPFPAVSTLYLSTAAMIIPSARARMPSSLPVVLDISSPTCLDSYQQLMHHLIAIEEQNAKDRQFAVELQRVCRKKQRNDIWTKIVQLDTSLQWSLPGAAQVYDSRDNRRIAEKYKDLYALMKSWSQVHLELVTLSVEVAIEDINNLSHMVDGFSEPVGDGRALLNNVRRGCITVLRTVGSRAANIQGRSVSGAGAKAAACNVIYETFELIKDEKPGYRQYFSSGCQLPTVRP